MEKAKIALKQIEQTDLGIMIQFSGARKLRNGGVVYKLN